MFFAPFARPAIRGRPPAPWVFAFSTVLQWARFMRRAALD